jgi:hypothetical protein
MRGRRLGSRSRHFEMAGPGARGAGGSAARSGRARAGSGDLCQPLRGAGGGACPWGPARDVGARDEAESLILAQNERWRRA